MYLTITWNCPIMYKIDIVLYVLCFLVGEVKIRQFIIFQTVSSELVVKWDLKSQCLCP